jgi:hypothetical protein
MAASELPAPEPGHSVGLRTRLRALASRLVSRLVPWATAVGIFTLLLQLIDDSFPAWLLRILTAVTSGLAAGLLVYVCIEELSKPTDEHDRLAKDIVEAARALYDDQRHRAVIEFRASASIVLQLLGKWSARAELGKIALWSSRAEGDRLAQASILVDDLGWSVFAGGDIHRALFSIEDGIALLNTMLDDPGTPLADRDQLLNLRAKARRHLVAVKVELRDFDGARSVLQAASGDAQQLSEPLQVVASAKLEYAAAYVLDRELLARLGSAGRLTPDGSAVRQLEETVSRCRSAITVFRERANLEWEARTATVLPPLLRRYAPDWEVNEAEAQAAAIQRQRARHRKTLSS